MHAPVFPTDIDSVRALGIDAWRSAFMWPIGDGEYDALLDTLWNAFDEVHAGLDGAAADTWLADTVAPAHVAQCVHYRLVAELCARRGIVVSARGASREWLEPDASAQRRELLVADMAGGRFNASARSLAKRWLLNGHLSLPARLLDSARDTGCWAIGSRSQLFDAYVRAEGLRPFYLYARQLIAPGPLGGGGAEDRQVHDGVGHVIGRLAEHCRRQWHAAPDCEAIAAAWRHRLSALAAAHRALTARRRAPKALLLTDVSRPLHKLIALALARRDCRVTGFQHGNLVGHLRQRSAAWHAHAHCHDFVTYTPAAAGLLDRAYREAPVATRKPVRFLAAPPSAARVLFPPLRVDPPERVRTVMLIGYPMNTSRYQYSAGDFYAFQLYAELRLAEVLRGAGYRVIYKAHPQRARELGDAFAGRVDEVLTEPFEATWNRADAFVFGCMTTTVFPLALLSPLPVAILDIEGLAWDPEAEARLKRRVISVPARFDGRNRLDFDADALLAGLSRPIANPNNEFMDTYMLGAANA